MVKIVRTPLWRQVADAIRAEILDGRYGPGEFLPFESAMVAEYGVSKPTIRQALAALRTEGLVIPRHGLGTMVRPAPAVIVDRPRAITRAVSKAGAGKAKKPAPAPAYVGADDPAVAGELVTVEVETPTTYRTNTDEVTGPALRMPDGEPLFAADRLLESTHGDAAKGPGRGRVRSLHRLFVPFAVAEGTALESDPFGPAGTVYGHLEAAGHGPLSWTETVTARMPLPDESAALDLPDATPLLHLWRTTYAADGTPVALEDVRTGSNGQRLVYAVAVQG